MVLAGRVLCVMMASVSGHVILERFYDPIPEPDQMRWRDRLHRAEASSGGAGASTVAESDCDKLASRCGVARHGDENMVWCGVGDLRFYAVGSGEYDEYGRESSPPPRSPSMARIGAQSIGSRNPPLNPPLSDASFHPLPTNNRSRRGPPSAGLLREGYSQEGVHGSPRVRALRHDLPSPGRDCIGWSRRSHDLGHNPPSHQAQDGGLMRHGIIVIVVRVVSPRVL